MRWPVGRAQVGVLYAVQHELISNVDTTCNYTVIGASSASPSTIAGPLFQQCRGASKKQGGSTQNTKDSLPKFLGIKLYGGQRCVPGNIIIRQRGTEFHPGVGVGMGRDHTIYALIEGNVKFFKDRRRNRRIINVLPPQLATS